MMHQIMIWLPTSEELWAFAFGVVLTLLVIVLIANWLSREP